MLLLLMPSIISRFSRTLGLELQEWEKVDMLMYVKFTSLASKLAACTRWSLQRSNVRSGFFVSVFIEYNGNLEENDGFLRLTPRPPQSSQPPFSTPKQSSSTAIQLQPGG